MTQRIHKNSLENSLRQEGSDFIFRNVHYNRKVIPEVRLLGNLMDNGSNKTHDRWRQYCRKHPEEGTILSSEMEYQLARKLYALRDVQNFDVQQTRDYCLAFLREDYIKNYLHTGTKITYRQGGLDAVVNHLELVNKERTSSLQIPEFTCYNNDWSYLVLANTQPESALGVVEDIPASAEPVLETLFGEGYEQAGAVWQFVSQRRRYESLRNVRLLIPTIDNRNIEHCVVFGVYGIGSSFEVNAAGSGGSRPARGWVDNSRRMY